MRYVRTLNSVRDWEFRGVLLNPLSARVLDSPRLPYSGVGGVALALSLRRHLLLSAFQVQLADFAVQPT
jgi:hypothetical protein